MSANFDKAIARAKEVLNDIDELVENLREALEADDDDALKEASNDLIAYCDKVK
ncbi:hypothetical protein [Campylobacter hyointestinalis]|uniref:hypothetical protein n=1 Tax=Campylobacter hyointestinalis TaxID=198 RepID=UPI0007265B0C|nr:hypothetical protein [Campylobacter hyointestinalis]CUU71978.1 Uncharacterised protein [Campylobacter hyointestinalis subsp. hyointestinalis]